MRSALRSKSILVGAILAALSGSSQVVHAQQLTFSLTWGWEGGARQDSAWWAMTNVLGRFNAYGDFTTGNDGNVEAAYSPGTPTADAGYNGQIRFGGTWPNDRVTLHEMNHWLGSGTWAHDYNGRRAISIIEQFEGVGARVGTDGTHFWPYGMNYDNEWSELGARRNVALTYAGRADWGIGSTANPKAWNATSVTLSASDAGGESGFNHYNRWNDGTFAHVNADYSTGGFDLRTPNGYPSWTFAGKSLTVNQGGRLLYNGWGHDGTVTIKNLTVDNGTIRHDQYDLDTFRLAGNMTIKGTATVDAGQGNVFIKSAITGTGSLAKTGNYDLTLQAANSYTGATTINKGTLRLAPTQLIADYTFDNVTGTTVVNGGAGGAAMNGTLANGATIVAAGGGRTGNAVRLSGGASVDINSGVADLAAQGNWAVSAWVNTTTAGGTILSKNDGAWNYGNTAFYLGDGNEGGSGNQPAGVRWAGGFLNAQPGTASVTNGAWHQVTYVNTGGTYTIYVDGIAKAVVANNAGFGVEDIGSLVRLGVANNPGDGALNFNGLMDGVQVYSQSLSASQVAALYAGKKLGSLPSSTVVTIANGARLDLAGTAQEVAGLNGVAGSGVYLNGGELIVNNPADSTFAGSISAGGSLVKAGLGTLTLTAGNSYGAGTTIRGGTLQINGQWALGGAAAGGLTFDGGTLKYAANLTGTNGSSDVTQDQNGRATPVTINAGGATIDTNGNDVSYARGIGNNGSGGLTKAGAGTLTLIGANTYTGNTVIAGGTLKATYSSTAASAATPMLSGPGFTDLQGGRLVLDHSASTSPIATVRALLAAGQPSNFATGQIRATTSAATPSRGIGYAELGGGLLAIQSTFYGDATLDGIVNVADLGALATNYGATDAVWAQGDFNYDAAVSVADLGLLATYYGSGTSLTAAGAAAQFRLDLASVAASNPEFAAAMGIVPEPTTLAAVGLAALAFGRRRRRTV